MGFLQLEHFYPYIFMGTIPLISMFFSQKIPTNSLEFLSQNFHIILYFRIQLFAAKNLTRIFPMIHYLIPIDAVKFIYIDFSLKQLNFLIY